MSLAPAQVAKPKASEPAVASTKPEQADSPTTEIAGLPRYLQPKLMVGAPDDPLEHEADRVADHVMRMPEPGNAPPPLAVLATSRIQRRCVSCSAPIETAIIQRKCAACAAADKEGSDCHCDEENPVRRRADTAHAAHHGSQPVGTAVASHIRGLQGGGAPLPQAALDQFEPRFGHDFSTVRVHTGGAAAESARELGAQAYTLGQDIVFAAGRYAPEMPAGQQLLAHELTHTIQQTGGAPLAPATASAAESASETVSRTREGHEPRGGAATRVGPCEDVAPQVVQQRSAPMVQRVPTDIAGNPLPMTASIYARHHINALLAAISRHLTATPLPQPHPRLPWTAEAEAIAAIIEELGSYVRADPGYGATRLYEMSYPADLWGVIDEMRGAVADPKNPRTSAIDVFHGPIGPSAWEPQVGIAVAAAFDDAIVGSIRRMGMRLRVQLDNPVRVEYSDLDRASLDAAAKASLSTLDLVASRPIDRVMASVLARPGIIQSKRKEKGTPDDTPGKPFLSGLRYVDYEWLGTRDRSLWNWIRVKSPAQPTAEDVAFAIYTQDISNPATYRSDQAFRILGSPPYFRIPVETAAQIAEANKFKPAEPADVPSAPPGSAAALVQIVRSVVKEATTPPQTPEVIALGQSAIADEVALAQAVPATKPDPRAEHAIERTQIQLDFLRQRLQPYQLDGWLAGAIAFVERRRAEARDPHSRGLWSTVAVVQERYLHIIASELAQVLSELPSQGATPVDTANLGPVMRVIEAYAAAAGVSHLGAEAPVALGSARRLRALLPLAFAEEKVRLTRQTVAGQVASQVAAGRTEPGSRETIVDAPELARRSAELRAKVARGDIIDADVVDQLAVDADEMTLRARLLTAATEAHRLQKRIEDVGLTTEKIESGYWTPYGQTDKLLEEIKKWQAELDQAKRIALEPAPTVTPTDDRRQESAFLATTGASARARAAHPPAPAVKPSDAQRRIQTMRKAITAVDGQMASFDKVFDINGLFTWANEQIADKQLSDALWSIAVQLGVAIITGQVAGAIVAGVRSFALAREAVVAGQLIADARKASMLYSALNLTLQAGLPTLTQRAMGGKGGPREFAENALGIVLTNAAMRPFMGLFKNPGAVAQEVRTWAQFAKRTGKFAARATVEIGVGIGAAHVAHSLTHFDQLKAATSDEFILQGISLVAGKFVHERASQMHTRINEAAAASGKVSGLKSLGEQVKRLEHRALAAAKNPSPEVARDLLVERRRLLLREGQIYQELAAAGHLVPQRRYAEDLAAFGAEFADVPLQFGGLKPVVEGQVYEGMKKQITDAFTEADKMGVPLERTFDDTKGVWRIKAGERTIEVHDRDWKPAPPPTESVTPSASGTAVKTEPVKTEPVTAEAKAPPTFPTNEFPESDTTWKQWPPPKEADVKPDWDKPGGTRFRYDRYRYQKWEKAGKPTTPPKDLLSPEQYYREHVAPKAVGQSPGEMGRPEHKALVVGVRDANSIGTQTMGEQRPDAVGKIDQAIKIPDGPTVTPQKGGRVLYEAEDFFKDGSQIVSKGRAQVRQFRKDNPGATIVVQDVDNPKNIIVYEPGTQPPPHGPLEPGTPNKVPVQ
jgi:hypothetical protein